MTLDVRVLFEPLDVMTVGARVYLPVDGGQVVAGQVLAVLGELDAEPLVRAAVQPGQESLDHRPRLQLHRPQPREDRGVEKPGDRAVWQAHAMTYIPLRGARHGLEQPLDQVVGGDVLGFGVEVRNDAMAEDRPCERLHVRHRDVIPAEDQRPGLGREDERLRGAQPRAPLHPLADERRGRPGGPGRDASTSRTA